MYFFVVADAPTALLFTISYRLMPARVSFLSLSTTQPALSPGRFEEKNYEKTPNELSDE